MNCVHKPLKQLVHLPAIKPDLTLTSSQWSHISHLDHRSRKIAEESDTIATIDLHKRSGICRVEKLHIRVEQSFADQYVLEEVVVEKHCCFRIKGGEVVVAGARFSGADCFSCCR